MIARDAIDRSSGRIISSEELLRNSAGPLYPAFAAVPREDNDERDARGLVVALGFCGLCWAGLAWFLLS
ncbi:hypothetical protein [Novosphingobium sp. 9]|uniref:hypothetical protein n=1 Tax=Novosphingobium sp. 9 TaxID=2025349 RepID=UPI0021B6089B|nr:hypothetical protein [Novosphingobium sp. 9]